MAGAGYKLFNTGDVLTAAQVNTYLQEQAVMRFANAAARTTALSGVLAEGMVTYLMDTDAVEVYNGTTWVPTATGDITGVTAGTGLSGGGTSGEVTLSLSVPVTEVRGGTNQTTYTTGDLLYASGTNTLAKRGIGSTGQVLTVSGGVPIWATGSSGALTKITANTFSNAATVDIADCFSSSYLYYLVVVDVSAANFGGSFNMQYLYSGSTVQSAGYYSSSFQYDRGNTLTTSGSANTTSARLLTYTGNSTTPSALSFMITNVGNASEIPLYWGSGSSWGQSIQLFAGGETGTARTYTGLRFFDTANNITGNYKVYGVQN